MKNIRIEITTRAYGFLCCLCCATLLFMGVPMGASADTENTSLSSSASTEQASSEESGVSTDSSADGAPGDPAAPLSDTAVSPTKASPQAAEPTEPVAGAQELAEQTKPSEDASNLATLDAPILQSVSGNTGSLTVSLSNRDDAFDDVSSFTNGITDWPIGELRTLRVDFEFVSGSNKAITVNIPTGYQIVGWSAMDGTPTEDALINIPIDPQYKDFFRTSTLVGTDGITDWVDQTLNNPVYWDQSAIEHAARTYGGIATYTFDDGTTRGELVLTLKPQDMTLSHIETSELLDVATITMASNKGTLSQSFQANVTELTEAMTYRSNGVWGLNDANVRYDAATGESEEFAIWCCTSSYNWDATYQSNQWFYADEWSATWNYPKGATFANKVNASYLGYGTFELNDPDYAPYLDPDHFTVEVTGDASTGGTVTMTFKDTTFFHSGGDYDFGVYFTADRDLADSDDMAFPFIGQLINHGQTRTWTENFTRSLVTDAGGYRIWMHPSNYNKRDLHTDYPEYPYDYALGAFIFGSELPYDDIPLSYDFSDLPGVRGIGSPGYNVHDIQATTTSGRTITLDSIAGKADNWVGVPITAEILGLNDDEYLTSLSLKVSLEQMIYSDAYTEGMVYYGRFVNGQEGDVVCSILDEDGNVAINTWGEALTATDHTTIRWENCGGQYMYTQAMDSDWNEMTTFVPNDKIVFNSVLSAAHTWGTDCAEIIDPTIMISLPKGINLDTSSVRAYSERGNHPGERVLLKQINTPKRMTINNVEWTTYYFTSPSRLDIVETECLPGAANSTCEVFFDAYVASNCPGYGQISLTDCVQWDLGKTAVHVSDWGNLTDSDTYNRTGKGTDYGICEVGLNYNIKPLIGLNVDLGIRVKGSGTDFFTYDTTENSVAAVSKTSNAEVRFSYQNTASSEYFAGSSIYLPIPKVGHDYSKYFQNIEVKDPLNVTDNQPFEFSANLDSEVNLPGFTTYYSMDATENSESYDPSVNASTWAPVTGTWMTYADFTANHALSEVTMLKLVADSDIDSGTTASGIFELAIDPSARIGQLDCWRAYSKAVTKQAENIGVWNHSSVIAATPVSGGLVGQFFLDLNHDGLFDATDGDSAYTDGHVTALLSRDDGAMDNVALAIDANGGFRALNANGSTYYLKSGDYTITFTNADPTYLFSRIPGAQASDASAWYNDLEAADISEPIASYHFNVDEDSLEGTYVGAALSDFVEIISIDVPVKVKLAVNTDGSWCTPTARDNRIINHSNVAITTADVTSTATSGFTLLDDPEDKATPNGFSGTISANDGPPVLLGQAQTPPALQWTMSADNGSTSDRSDELALQLNGHVQNINGHYFTAPIHLFDNTYTFEKAL